jgi:hypothetical protein
MRGVYDAHILISGLAAAKTVLYITAPSDNCVEILSADITNATNETNEQCRATWQRVTTLGTPTGTTLTPSPHEQDDQAAASTVVGNVTASEPTYGSNTEVGHMGFSSLSGYYYTPLPEERLMLKAAQTWGLRILNSPTAFDAVVRVSFREIG